MIDLVIARLKTEVTLVRNIGGSANLESARTGKVPAPLISVIPLAETAGPNQFTGTVVQQQTSERFGVVVGVRNVRDPAGAASMDELKPVRDEIRAALLGWLPAEGYDTCTYRSGRVLGLQNGVLWWIDEFMTGTLIRSE